MTAAAAGKGHADKLSSHGESNGTQITITPETETERVALCRPRGNLALLF